LHHCFSKNVVFNPSGFKEQGGEERQSFRYPIQVKQSEHIGRNVVDNFETALQRVKKDMGYIIAFSFGKGAYEEVARAKKQGLHIELLQVDKLLEYEEEAKQGKIL